MLEPSHPLAQLLEQDSRFPLDAYLFVFEALNFAQGVMGLGEASESEPHPEVEEEEEPAQSEHQHVSGQDLCHAIRRFALDQYGYMAKTVLGSWNIRKTGDFGDIVYNLIEIGQMRKTPDDRREDFNDVYNFDTALIKQFEIVSNDPS